MCNKDLDYGKKQMINAGFTELEELGGMWSAYDVRYWCIEHDCYTAGSNESYSRMLDYVKEHPHPSRYDVELVATDIVAHSYDEDFGYYSVFDRDTIESVVEDFLENIIK